MHLSIDEKQKRLSPSEIGTLILTAVLLMFSGCAFPFSPAKIQSEIQLSTALFDSFTRGWFDKCSVLQNVAKTATEQGSGKSADYLLDYLQGSSPFRVGYFLRNIYFSQSELKDQLIPTDAKRSLNSLTAAESDYLEQLGNRLQTDGRVLQEEAFQRNTQELAELILYTNICADDLKERQEVELFQSNLKKAIQLMRAAFPQSNPAGAFAPSDNIIILPAS